MLNEFRMTAYFQFEIEDQLNRKRMESVIK